MQPNVVSGEANPLSYRVDNGEIGDGGYLRSFGGSGVGLLFTEGTELRLAAGARGRLTSVDGQGARFAIEQGEAEINVIPRNRRALAHRRRSVPDHRARHHLHRGLGRRARAASGHRMKHGLVSVSGPVAERQDRGARRPAADHQVPEREVLLRIWRRRGGIGRDRRRHRATGAAAPGRFRRRAERPEAPAAVGARVQSSSSMRSSAARAAVAVRTSAPRSWTAALAAGDFQTILGRGGAAGYRRSLADARSEDLAALADAARYLRRDDVARQALIAQRDRFPQSDRAHEAAFLLGRLTRAAPKAEGPMVTSARSAGTIATSMKLRRGPTPRRRWAAR